MVRCHWLPIKSQRLPIHTLPYSVVSSRSLLVVHLHTWTCTSKQASRSAATLHQGADGQWRRSNRTN